MKKYAILFILSALVFVLCSCEEEHAYASDFVSVDDDGDGMTAVYPDPELRKFAFNGWLNGSGGYTDETQEGSKLTNLLGYKVDLEYEETYQDAYRCREYFGNNILARVETDSGFCSFFTIYESAFPQGYEVNHEPVDIDTAQKYAKDFFKKHYSDISIDEYTLESSKENEGQFKYSFVFRKYVRDVIVHTVELSTDKCGNVIYLDARRLCDESIVPNITDKEYIEMAKDRFEEFYGHIDHIESVECDIIDKKYCNYYAKIHSWTIDYTVQYTVNYSDGTVFKGARIFIYPFAIPEGD